MFSDRISDYFEGAAAKYLSAVDADPEKSNQHEIGGLPSVGFKQWLGTPSKDQKLSFPSRQVYLADTDDYPVIHDGQVSWYDCRYKNPSRSPEYRLYYVATPVTRQIRAGDFCLIAKHKNGSLLMVFTPQGSSVERQLRLIFGLGAVGQSFQEGALDEGHLLLPVRLLLEDIGIELNHPASDDDFWLDRLLEKFGGEIFPSTKEFSAFARSSIAQDIDPENAPDDTLMRWMLQEERFFRLYERNIVRERLTTGFGKYGDDVEEFISFSLSVQNRRKSRVGHAFEGHLNTLFKAHGLKFQQGGAHLYTENSKRPDFLFPSFAAYHDPDFPVAKLMMLGAKTTCKDRWRQVLSEADKISIKHLVTLEPSISESQTNEMQARQLQLVVPESLHTTYTSSQQGWLFSLKDFIGAVRVVQSK